VYRFCLLFAVLALVGAVNLRPVFAEEAPAPKLGADTLLECDGLQVSAKEVYDREASVIKANPAALQIPGGRAGLRKQLAFDSLAGQLFKRIFTENKLEIPKADLAETLENVNKSLKQRGRTYEEFTAGVGRTPAEYEAVMGMQLAVATKFGADAKPEELKGFLEKIHAQADTIEQQMPLRKCSHILISYKGAERNTVSALSKEEAQKKATELLAKLKAGEDFAKTAKESSNCPSAPEGGDLGWNAQKGGLVQEFSDPLYKLAKVGDTTDVVETAFGFHIIKLTGLKTADKLLRDAVGSDKLRTILKDMLDDKNPKLHINQDALNAGVGDPLPETPAKPVAPDKTEAPAPPAKTEAPAPAKSEAPAPPAKTDAPAPAKSE